MNTCKNTCRKYIVCGDYYPLPNEPHNTKISKNAEEKASFLKKHPIRLERMMQEFLDAHRIKYEHQYIFYIKSKGGFIEKYYIVDFYIPKRKIVIEMQGPFYVDDRIYNKHEAEDLHEQYPRVTVMKCTTDDFNSSAYMEELLRKIK